MSSPSAGTRRDLSARRLELAVSGAYDQRGGFTCLEVHSGWPSHLLGGAVEGFCCDGCPTSSWHADPPAVWLDYAEQASASAEVGAWTIMLCDGCAVGLGDSGDSSNLLDALVHFEIAGREYRDAEAQPSPAARRMKEAQLHAAAIVLGAALAPVLARLGCDRESVRLALGELHIDDEIAQVILDDVAGHWCA